MNHPDSSLFPEDELRRRLQQAANAPAPDPAFEAAVLAQIRRRQQRPALALALAAVLVVTLLAAGALWMVAHRILPEFLPRLLLFITHDLPDYANTARGWIAAAPALAAPLWQQFRPLLFLTLAAVFSSILILEISAILILNRRKIRS